MTELAAKMLLKKATKIHATHFLSDSFIDFLVYVHPGFVPLQTVLVHSELSELNDCPDAADVELGDASGLHVKNEPR